MEISSQMYSGFYIWDNPTMVEQTTCLKDLHHRQCFCSEMDEWAGPSRLHRCCTGLTKSTFKSLSSDSSLRFLAPNCKIEAQSSQIAELQSAVADLMHKLSALIISDNQASTTALVSTPGSVPAESSLAITNLGRPTYCCPCATERVQLADYPAWQTLTRHNVAGQKVKRSHLRHS